MDGLILSLRERRAEAGTPSYADIAARVMADRQARGIPEYEARIARTTVYDLFRVGRKRIDADLVAEVVRSLGADEAEVAAWRARCAEAARPANDQAVPVVDERLELPPLSAGRQTLQRLRAPLAVALMIGCLALNLAGDAFNKVVPFDLYLDMIGTAIAAIVLGPWHGALVGVLTNVGEAHSSHNWNALWFGLCNGGGALIWGYGVRRGLGRSIPRFVGLNALVALFVTCLATVIIVSFYDGHTGHGSDGLVDTMLQRGQSMVVSVFSTNLLNSLCDKMLAGFIALFVVDAIMVRQSGESTPLKLG
ncbi:hypothetical protein [Nocardioides sp. Kera G14]|uniref:hypothetical protein n=1 Tax=Nocardioides sp. Kera G14 TaxID=2884264 RepID=UPI001D101B28|nr:hypothetical protein [Nocardioides sp. Kera G14]UDY24349.1 hypothetical protein LH076_03335 [Nocardioides sp. Kera G14]